jgi:hypothetical protein
VAASSSRCPQPASASASSSGKARMALNFPVDQQNG